MKDRAIKLKKKIEIAEKLKNKRDTLLFFEQIGCVPVQIPFRHNLVASYENQKHNKYLISYLNAFWFNEILPQ